MDGILNQHSPVNCGGGPPGGLSPPPPQLPPPPQTSALSARPQLSPAAPPPPGLAVSTSPMLKMEKPIYSSPPPATSNHENNQCRLIEYRGVKVAAFIVDGRELICLPQAFDLFLKHLVGGLHTVYTKLKRLDVIPIVCNVEQVRILRGLGAIQPGVNRCKLISPKEFDILYEDCTNSSARPGRPPKRSALAPPDTLDKLKKSRMDNGDFGYGPNRLMDLKKSPLFSNGYHYPPHLAHIPFMGPLAHPAMMNLAMANHLGMRPDMMAHRDSHPADLSTHRHGEEKDHDGQRGDLHKAATMDMDKPLNLGLPRHDDRRHCHNDRDSVNSTPSDTMGNGQLDLSLKSAMHSGNDDLDADDESEEDKDDDDDLDNTDMSTNAPVSHCEDEHTKGGVISGQPGPMTYSSQLMNTDNSGAISSVETLLMNIQGLLKVAAENARHREQQTNFERAELKMEILKEREVRENLEKQLMDEQKNKIFLVKRLKKEKKARRRLQDQLDAFEHAHHQSRSQLSQLPQPHSHQMTSQMNGEDHIKQAQENLRMLNAVARFSESIGQDTDNEKNGHSDSERKLTDAASRPPTSGIQNLMESFLASAQKSSQSSCSSANGYMHSPVIKQTEAV